MCETSIFKIFFPSLYLQLYIAKVPIGSGLRSGSGFRSGSATLLTMPLLVIVVITHFILNVLGGRHYALYSLLSISNKFCFQVYCNVYNLTALYTILPHCV